MRKLVETIRRMDERCRSGAHPNRLHGVPGDGNAYFVGLPGRNSKPIKDFTDIEETAQKLTVGIYDPFFFGLETDQGMLLCVVDLQRLEDPGRRIRRLMQYFESYCVCKRYPVFFPPAVCGKNPLTCEHRRFGFGANGELRGEREMDVKELKELVEAYDEQRFIFAEIPNPYRSESVSVFIYADSDGMLNFGCFAHGTDEDGNYYELDDVDGFSSDEIADAVSAIIERTDDYFVCFYCTPHGKQYWRIQSDAVDDDIVTFFVVAARGDEEAEETARQNLPLAKWEAGEEVDFGEYEEFRM